MFDILTVAAVADQLQGTVLDSRIQKLGLVNSTTIAAELYVRGERRALIASADAERPLVYLDSSMPSVDPNLTTPFGLQLRKYVRGGFLVGIEQPPMERIIRLSIVKRLHDERLERERTRRHHAEHRARVESGEDDDHDAEGDVDIWDPNLNRVQLVIEIMGRHSNLILLDHEGKVMESAKRVTTRMSRVRPILPRIPYSLPPVPDKQDPRRLTSASAGMLLQSAKPADKLSDALVRGLRGMSPQMGQELAFVVLGRVDGKVRDVPQESLQELARQTRGMFEAILTSAWAPQVYLREYVVVGYSAVPMTHLTVDAQEVEMPSISDAVARAQDAVRLPGPEDHVQRRAQLGAAIGRELEKVRQRMHSLEVQHQRVGRVADLRTWGEMIYAYLWQIQPGDDELVVEEMRIPLDPALSGKDNAAAYFDDYRKSQKAGASLPARIAEGNTEIDYLRQLQTQANQADGFAGIEAVRLEFEEHSGGRELAGERASRPGRKAQAKRSAAITDVDGNVIHIGRSGKENDHVTFDLAGPDDIWLHARGVPGSHVIIRWLRPHEDENAMAVETGAALAAWYSASRASGSVEVDVTRRRHVRKIKGAGPGMVTYRQEHTIAVMPRDEEELRKLGRLD